MKTLAALALCLVTLSACASEGPESELATQEDASALASPEQLVGRFKFVFEGERKAQIFAELESKLSGAELEAAKAEVLAEVEVSVLEFREDGRFISWVGEKAVVDTTYRAAPAGDNVLTLTSGEGRSTTVTLLDSDTIVVADPQKGDLKFARVK